MDNSQFGGPVDPFPGLVATRLCWPLNVRPAGASLHAKLLVIDDVAALVGSANITTAAFAKNFECGLLVRGGATAGTIRRQVSDLWGEGLLGIV